MSASRRGAKGIVRDARWHPGPEPAPKRRTHTLTKQRRRSCLTGQRAGPDKLCHRAGLGNAACKHRYAAPRSTGVRNGLRGNPAVGLSSDGHSRIRWGKVSEAGEVFREFGSDVFKYMIGLHKFFRLPGVGHPRSGMSNPSAARVNPSKWKPGETVQPTSV